MTYRQTELQTVKTLYGVRHGGHITLERDGGCGEDGEDDEDVLARVSLTLPHGARERVDDTSQREEPADRARLRHRRHRRAVVRRRRRRLRDPDTDVDEVEDKEEDCEEGDDEETGQVQQDATARRRRGNW